MNAPRLYPIEEALQAQKALRAAIGLSPELFPIEAFVGMISEEIEQLRDQGRTDAEIADIVRSSSAIQITPGEIAEHYAPPETRKRHGAQG